MIRILVNLMISTSSCIVLCQVLPDLYRGSVIQAYSPGSMAKPGLVFLRF